MSRIIAALSITAVLAGCDGKNPFQTVTGPDGSVEELEEGDPNVDVNNRYAWDPAQNLTMNSVDYDETNNELVINNLPFDGPDGRYDQINTLPTGDGLYASRQTTTTGQVQHFAVFINSDFMEATSASGRDWIDFGNAGANINRDSFALPGGPGEYIYRGNYAATRTFSERSGIEIVSGDVQLLLDILDFDPFGELQGDITGSVFNRDRFGIGPQLGELPPIVLAEISFNTETGVWEGGSATTFDFEGDPRSTGIHEGMIAGPDGEEMGGYVIITGTADIQRVTYQVVTYEESTFIPTLNPLTGEPFLDLAGDPIGTTVTTTTTVSGFDDVDLDALQTSINNGNNLPDYIPVTGVPAGADIIEDRDLFQDFSTEYDAREIGVFIGDQVPG